MRELARRFHEKIKVKRQQRLEREAQARIDAYYRSEQDGIPFAGTPETTEILFPDLPHRDPYLNGLIEVIFEEGVDKHDPKV